MDLVYSVRAGKRRALPYVLAEHQSKVEPWMAFRLLCYLVAIWKGYRTLLRALVLLGFDDLEPSSVVAPRASSNLRATRSSTRHRSAEGPPSAARFRSH